MGLHADKTYLSFQLMERPGLSTTLRQNREKKYITIMKNLITLFSSKKVEPLAYLEWVV